LQLLWAKSFGGGVSSTGSRGVSSRAAVLW
jgi:hypothetical protein